MGLTQQSTFKRCLILHSMLTGAPGSLSRGCAGCPQSGSHASPHQVLKHPLVRRMGSSPAGSHEPWREDRRRPNRSFTMLHEKLRVGTVRTWWPTIRRVSKKRGHSSDGFCLSVNSRCEKSGGDTSSSLDRLCTRICCAKAA